MNDLKFAIRQLLKNPGFTAVAVITLALGIGAMTAIVSVVEIAVFDPLPTAHPERLLQLGNRRPERAWSPGVNRLTLRELRSQTDLFARVTAYYWDMLTLRGEVYPEPLRGTRVTPNFFNLWSVKPALGRTFAEDEARPGNDSVLVLGHRLWQSRFGGDPAIIGRAIAFRERPMTVIGVMPPHFSFPEGESEYWRPSELPDADSDDFLPNTQAMVEMRPGVAKEQVQAFLDVLSERLRSQDRSFDYSFEGRDLREMFSSGEVRRAFGLLLGATAFVLLIAAANVANLQLARTETRWPELAVRAALGAGRRRVFRQLLTESLLLAGLGGIAALAVAGFGLDLLQRLVPPELPRLKEIALNARVLGVASLVTLATGLIFGLAPAWTSRQVNLSEVLKLGAGTSTGRSGGWFSRFLIVSQVALVLVLLTGAGLMVRTLVGLLRVHPGLDPKHLVRVYPSILEREQRGFNPDPSQNKAPDTAIGFFAEARQRVAAIPGVTDVGVAFEGRAAEATAAAGSAPIQMQKFWIGIGEANALRVMRVPLKEGRWLERSDVGSNVRSVLLNETAARRLWPGQTVVGKQFRVKERRGDALYEVVGVVGDTLDFSRYVPPQPTFYRALQNEAGVDISPKWLIVRTAANPFTLYRPINQTLKEMGTDLRMPEFYNLHEVIWARMAGHRALMLYLSLFAGAGLLLAAIGLYGVLAFTVGRRRREIGIRIALGAQVRDVMRLILRQGMALAVLGGAVGMFGALAAGKALRGYLFGVSGPDPLTLIAVASLLFTVALLACWLPARRAAKVDPMEALRHE